MQSQSIAAPSLVLAGNFSADQLFSSLDACLESPMGQPQQTDNSAIIINEHGQVASSSNRCVPQSGVRLHLDLRRCTREHRLGDALALVHYLSGRVGRLDITVDTEAQAGFGEVITVIGKSHGLAVSVQ